jgi:cysteine synthase A
MTTINSENPLNNSDSVRFLHITEGKNATGQAKFEGSIPDYLAKYRATINLIKDAEERGSLKPGMEIIEPALDSTGVVMAYVAADRGYNLTLTVPETMSPDHISVLSELGAKLILTSATEGQKGAIKRAEEITAAEPHKYFMVWKFNSPDITAIHTTTRQHETIERDAGIINISVSSERTSGTFTGVSRYTQNIKGNIFLRQRQH